MIYKEMVIPLYNQEKQLDSQQTLQKSRANNKINTFKHLKTVGYYINKNIHTEL